MTLAFGYPFHDATHPIRRRGERVATEFVNGRFEAFVQGDRNPFHYPLNELLPSNDASEGWRPEIFLIIWHLISGQERAYMIILKIRKSFKMV